MLRLKFPLKIILPAIALILSAFLAQDIHAQGAAETSEKEIEGLKFQNKQLQDNIAGLKNLNAQLEAKAADLFQQLSKKEDKEQEAAQLNKVVAALAKERTALNNQVSQLGLELEKLKSQRAANYMMAAEAYMKSELYDSAFEAYNKLLELEPGNAQAHLALGFLYKRSRDNPGKAVYHFRQYLRLSQPDAKNRKEIEYLIKMLSE